MSSRDPWQAILRIILDDLTPQVRRVPPETLKQVLRPILFRQGKGELSLSDGEKTREEREFYILAGIMALVTEVLLRARLGGRAGDVCKTLDPYAAQIVETLDQKVQEVQESTFWGGVLLGRVLQSLMHPVTRKHLGAFYTKPIVAKLLSRLLINDGKGQFIDPACGTGALLTAAFQRFQELDGTTNSSASISRIRGNEVSAIARLCAETNLILSAGHPPEMILNISQGDAFHLDVTPSNKVDYFGTNPPFTRGELLSPTYKAFLRDFFSHQTTFAGEAKSRFCSKNMPLYGYFLLDMDRFLRPGGRFSVVLPASALHLAGLRSVRQYLLAHYTLEYVITSDVELFSEDSDLKEILLVGCLREEIHPVEAETTFLTIFTPLTLQNYAELANAIEHPDETKQAEKVLRTHRVSQKDLGEGIADWSTFFPPEANVNIYEQLLSIGKMERIRNLEGDVIEVFRGFRQDFAKYWAVPNSYWKVKESRPDYIKVENVEDPKFQIRLTSGSWYRGLSRPEFYPRPLIKTGHSYILKESQTAGREEGMDQYLAWIKQHFGDDAAKYGKFIQQLRQIGTRFNFAGRIAFCHRIDVTTSKVICYLTQDAVQLNQNWFSIRGLDPVAEEFLVAWFNSTPFIASYILRRRTQRGPYGQTAVREFKEYLVPYLDKLDSEQIQHVINQFQAFNQSPEFGFPISQQFSRCLFQETARKEFDLVLLDAIQVFPSQRQKQRQFLEQIYCALVANIDKIRLQGKRIESL